MPPAPRVVRPGRGPEEARRRDGRAGKAIRDEAVARPCERLAPGVLPGERICLTVPPIDCPRASERVVAVPRVRRPPETASLRLVTLPARGVQCGLPWCAHSLRTF